MGKFCLVVEFHRQGSATNGTIPSSLVVNPKVSHSSLPSPRSELPAFLVKDGGLNSGFMIAHCTAAALVSENKTLCHPARCWRGW